MRPITCLSIALGFGALTLGAADSVSTENAFGVLRVDSAASRTIIAVPWVASDGAGGDIRVADLVKTSNLTAAGDGYEGDTLYYYTGQRFKAWRLNPADASGVPRWEPVRVASAGQVDAGTPPDVQAVPRGEALVLVRRNPNVPIYLQGQVGAAMVAAPTIATGTPANPVYSLIAPPGVPDAARLDVSTDIAWSNVPSGDRLYVYRDSGETVECQYREGKWQWCEWVKTNGRMTASWKDATIAVGTGMWYKSASATAPTCVWKLVPGVK